MARLQDLQRELAQQARSAYRYWPLFLVRRVRQLERHVGAKFTTVIPPPSSVPMSISARWVAATDVAVLREYGLPLPDELPRVAMPDLMRLPSAEKFWFHAAPIAGDDRLYALTFLRQEHRRPSQSAAPRSFRLELMRVEARFGWYLDGAAHCLERMAARLGYEVAFQAARIWSVLHGGEPQSWKLVPADDLPVYLQSDALAPKGDIPASMTKKGYRAQDSANMWDFLNS